MNIVRMRVTDRNNAQATIAMYVKESIEWADAVALTDVWLNCIKPVLAQRTILSPIENSNGTGASGPTSTIYDLAVLAFRTSGPYPISVTLLGPGSIFLPDGVTVDAGLTQVANLIAAVVSWGTDRVENPVTGYVTGRRK